MPICSCDTGNIASTIVEFALKRASTGPEEIASSVPYISILPPKL